MTPRAVRREVLPGERGAVPDRRDDVIRDDVIGSEAVGALSGAFGNDFGDVRQSECRLPEVVSTAE